MSLEGLGMPIHKKEHCFGKLLLLMKVIIPLYE